VDNFDEIPPICKITVEIQCPEQPRSVKLQPEGRELPYTWENGVLTVPVEYLEIYDIIEIIR